MNCSGKVDDFTGLEDSFRKHKSDPHILELTKELKILNLNIQNLLQDNAHYERTRVTNELEMKKLQKEISTLMRNTENTFGPFFQQIKDDMFDMKCHIRKLEEESNKLTITCQSQSDTIESLRNNNEELKALFSHQSLYVTSIGLNLGSLLWRASKEQEVVKSLIVDGRFMDFLEIVRDTIHNFFDAFSETSDSSSTEVQFVVSLIGIIANVAATPQGREIISTTSQGEAMLQQFLLNVAKIPKSCIYVQRLMLMGIFNISIHKLGSKLIVNHPELLQLLMKNALDLNNDLKFLSLKLLQSITYAIEDEFWLSLIQHEITDEKLIEIENNSSEEELKFVLGIRNNIDNAVMNFLNVENRKIVTENNFYP